MLDFKQSMNHAYDAAKEALERMPYTKIVYPQAVNEANWDFTVPDDLLPKMDSTLYFIYDSEKTLLYVGKSKKIDFALRSHLLRKTSKSTCSILEPLKLLLSESKEKCVYIKVLAVGPVEYGGCLKPLFIREFQPLWVRRIN